MFFSFISVLIEIMIVTFLLGMLILLLRPNRRCTPVQIRLKRIFRRGMLAFIAIAFLYGFITIYFELRR
ncbi:MAG: hypothetical protein IJ644_07660 [Oscillospiraceae bacterium]|nr:hypothetical protein [Oscillospiraceae bacterium]